MATFGGSGYSLSISNVDGTNSTKSKTISGINYNATGAGGGSTALGADVDLLYDFGMAVSESIMGGSYPSVSFTDKRPIENL